MSLPNNDRRSQPESGNKFPPFMFVTAIAGALRREFGAGPGGPKRVVNLTGANERAVRNWFDAKNGPNGEFLIALCRHSDEVLGTVLTLAGRSEHVRAMHVSRARERVTEILVLLQHLEEPAGRNK